MPQPNPINDHPMVQSVQQGMQQMPNVSGIQNPATGQHNSYAPIPPDEVKRWAELNHVSKGSVKQVEWSQNVGKYIFSLKNGDNEQVDPQYILANQGHWAPHPDHLNEALKFIGGRMAQQNIPKIMSAMRMVRGAGGAQGGQAPPPMPMAPQATMGAAAGAEPPPMTGGAPQ
jgi:hypothetical protein